MANAAIQNEITDRNIPTIVTAANNADIETSKLARSKTKNPEVMACISSRK